MGTEICLSIFDVKPTHTPNKHTNCSEAGPMVATIFVNGILSGRTMLLFCVREWKLPLPALTRRDKS